jgi:hypothetical protein
VQDVLELFATLKEQVLDLVQTLGVLRLWIRLSFAPMQDNLHFNEGVQVSQSGGPGRVQ